MRQDAQNAKVPESIIDESDLALDRYNGNIFVITMKKAPENRLNSKYAQKLIATFNKIRQILGKETEGAVITRGNDAKFWCTVRSKICVVLVMIFHGPLHTLETLLI